MKVARDAKRACRTRLRHGAHGSQGRLRRRHRLSRKISRKAAPYRNPDFRRRQGQGHPSRRARLLACSAAIRRSWRRAPRPRSTRTQRKRDRRNLRRRHARAAIFRRRHDRVPLRERRVLFHRNEHAHPGRASGDGNDHRRRSRLSSRSRSPPARRCRCGRRNLSSTATPSNAASTPSIPRPSGPRPARIALLSSAGRRRRARRFARSIRATRSRPITIR